MADVGSWVKAGYKPGRMVAVEGGAGREGIIAAYARRCDYMLASNPGMDQAKYQKADIRKCKPAVIVYPAVPCQREALWCLIFRYFDYMVARMRLEALVPMLRGAGEDYAARADYTLQIYREVARAMDATNINPAFRSPLGTWASPARPFDREDADTYFAAAVEKSLGRMPRPTQAMQKLYQKPAKLISDRGEWLRQRVIETNQVPEGYSDVAVEWPAWPDISWGEYNYPTKYRDPHLRYEPFMPVAYQDPLRGMPRFDMKHKQRARFIRSGNAGTPSQASVYAWFQWYWQYGRGGDVIIPPPEDTKKKKKKRRRRRLRRIGATFAMGIPVVGASGPSSPPSEAELATLGVWCGPKHMEELAIAWAEEIIGKPFSDHVVVGVYNWVLQTEIMIWSGIVTANTAFLEQLEQDFEESLNELKNSDEAVLGAVGEDAPIMRAVMKIITYVFAWFVGEKGPAVGHADCMLSPFTRVATMEEPCSTAADPMTADTYSRIRNELFPKLQSELGIPLGQFIIPTENADVPSSATPWWAYAVGGALVGGAAGALAWRK